MLGAWLRILVLWSCRFLGTIQGFCRRPLIIHLVLIGLIAAGLWLVDQRVLVLQGVGILSSATRTSETANARSPGQASGGPAQDGAQDPPGAEASGASTNATPRQAGPAAQAGERAAATPATAAKSKDEESAGLPPEGKLWFTWRNTLSIWAFGLVAWWALRSRRRLVISGFEDFADKQSGIDPGGLGILVAAELARLTDLFKEFEEGRSIQSTPGKLKPVNAMFQTESTGEFLGKTVSAETKFSLGWLQIPVGAILGLVGRLVQGPRVSGQIHCDRGTRRITLRLTGTPGDRTWSIVDPALTIQSEKPVWRPAADVAHELACCLFTELALERTLPWQALAHFVAGVEAYRRSLRTPQKRILNLKEAERRLIEAIAEAPNFDLALYNLGVVYVEQQKLDAAERAFTRSLGTNNQRAATYYALAMVSYHLAVQAFEKEEPDAARLYLSKSIDLCDQGLRLSASSEEAARILSLEGNVCWWRGWRMWNFGPATQREFLNARVRLRRAIWNAWRAMCRVELGFNISALEKASALARAKANARGYLETRAGMMLALADFFERQSASLPAADAVRSGAPSAAAESLARGKELLHRLELRRGFRAFIARLGVRAGNRFIGIALALEKKNLALGIARFVLRLLRVMSLRRATHDLRQACSLAPDVAANHLDLGITYVSRRKFTKAIGALRCAARLAPTSTEPWWFLALALAHSGSLEQTSEASRRALEKIEPASERYAKCLQALEEAVAVVKSLFEEIQAFPAACEEQRRRMNRIWYWRWSRRRRRHLARRLAGPGHGVSRIARQLLQGLLARPDELNMRIHACESVAVRVKALGGLFDKIEELEKRDAEGVEPLQILFKEQQDLNQDWEVAEIGHKLARLYKRLGRPADAEKCLRQTIAYLRKSLQGEIQRRGLYAILAGVLRAQGNLPVALETAREGVDHDPVSNFERTELGWVFWNLADFPAARVAWEEALLLGPEDPRLHVNVGLAHLREMADCKDKPARAGHLEAAGRFIRTAIDLFDAADNGRHDARYLLAQVYSSMSRFADARRELRTLECSGYCTVAVGIELADSHLSNSDWAEAEQAFNRIAAMLDRRMAGAEKGVNERIDVPFGADELVLGTASAFAHLGIAASLAGREIRLDKALAEVESARSALNGLDNAAWKDEWLARCTFHEGEILLAKGNLDNAVARFETALATHTWVSRYLSLADALARKADLTADAVEKTRLARRAAQYYEEARRQDWNGDLETRISKALAQLPVPHAATSS